jgi:Protein of unknown function (DUF3489)
MVKLTDNQLIVLSKAAASEDGAAVLPLTMNKAAAAKIGSSLIGRKLMREIRSKPGMPVWHGDADGRSMSLVITRAGRNAIDINEPDESYQQVSNKSDDTKRDRYLAGAAPRAGSKQALVVKLLSKQQGATLHALIEATGWLPHTTRAALTGLRKRGFAVERIRNATKGSFYRIANDPNAAAGA